MIRKKLCLPPYISVDVNNILSTVFNYFVVSRRSFSTRSVVSEASTIFGPEKEQVLTEKMRIIVDAFRNRAAKVKDRLEQPPTPTEDMSDEDTIVHYPKLVLDDFNDSLYASKSTIGFGETTGEKWKNVVKRMEYIDPRGYTNIGTNNQSNTIFFILVLGSRKK